MAQILIRNVDEGTRRAFKAALAERGETMQTVLRDIVDVGARGVDIAYVLDRALEVARAALGGTRDEAIKSAAKNIIFQLEKTRKE